MGMIKVSIYYDDGQREHTGAAESRVEAGSPVNVAASEARRIFNSCLKDFRVRGEARQIADGTVPEPEPQEANDGEPTEGPTDAREGDAGAGQADDSAASPVGEGPPEEAEG